MTNKELLYSAGNSIQYSVIANMGKESKKEWTHVYVSPNLGLAHLRTSRQHRNGLVI